MGFLIDDVDQTKIIGPAIAGIGQLDRKWISPFKARDPGIFIFLISGSREVPHHPKAR